MRPLALLLAAAALAAAQTPNDTNIATNITDTDAKSTVFLITDLTNDTNIDQPEFDADGEPIVRKKRTFGDIVFRGLADVLGYNVARKPPQAAFPPPLDPVPGIDIPLQAGPAPAPAPAPAPPPCGAPRAVNPPCRPPPPPPPPPPRAKAPPPCPRPRANPRPKPRPTPAPAPPPPPPPPPCARPRANPATPAPCAPPPPPPPRKAADNLETISSNFRLNFNFNRVPATPAPAAPAADDATFEDEALEEEQPLVAIEPRAARLPQPQTKPRVYVDAFVVRNGVPQRVDTVDAANLGRRADSRSDYDEYVSDDYLDRDDDDYDTETDAQESRDRAKAVKKFGAAVDQFWDSKTKKSKPKRKLPADHYERVHFGDRDAARRPLHLQNLKRERDRTDDDQPDENVEAEVESTTSTENPRRPLKPRVLPPTEHNPNQIDTVTVRVPPIYKEKRPKKLHRGRPEREEEEEEFHKDESDTDGEHSAIAERTEPPVRRRRRKQSRRTRSAKSDEDYDADHSISEEEKKFYEELNYPAPTRDPDVLRHEQAKDPFLNDSERISEDPEKLIEAEEEEDSETERADESERSNTEERADESERSDKLSPGARVRETGYVNNYVRATQHRVDDPRPRKTPA